ncbi:MAG: hypothetical protein SFT92_06500 [Rickettsiales bacterium]|nr:hypothetical protein [Rickettsiales bacterium]
MELKLKRRNKAEQTNSPKKPKIKKASRGKKFVLFVGDEGAILVYIRDNFVQSRQFVPDASLQSLDELRENISKDPKAPLMLVIDTMDQSYVQQTLPPVSSLSVGKLIKRRLDRDFGASDIKGALMLGREKTGRRDWNFLMIAVEQTPQLSVWLDFIANLPNYFRGIYLVAVETETLVKSLDAMIQLPADSPKSEWKFVVTHNKVSGFRQVILHNGRVVFTRLAQPIGDSNVEVIAGNIEQEMLGTIEYMKRLSFNPQSGLDIYILASSGVKAAIDRNKFSARNFHLFTPFEITEYLNIQGATQPADQYGDVVLASSIGTSRKHILTLSVPLFKKMHMYYNLLLAQRLVVACLVLGALAYIGTVTVDLLVKSDQKQELNGKKAEKQSELIKLKSEISRTQLDVEGAGDIIDLYTYLLYEKLSPIPFFQQLAAIKQSPVALKKIDWTLDVMDAKAAAKAGNAAGVKNTKITSIVTLEFPEAENNARAFNKLTENTLLDFKKIFEGYEVKYLSKVSGTGESDVLDVNLSATAPATEPKIMTDGKTPEAQISIKGTMKLDKPAILATPNGQKKVQ